jgi:hypothetical protein
VALLQLLSAYSSQGRVSMLIAAGGAVATLVLAVGNLASAVVLIRRASARTLLRIRQPHQVITVQLLITDEGLVP